MVQGHAGGAKGARMALRGACGAEISRQCVGCEARGLDNVGELQAVRACRMGLSKSPKSMRYNFPAPVCGTYRFTSSQVDTVLDLSEIESASPFEFITQTFAVFCVGVACEARSNDARDAKRMVQGRAGGRRVCAWSCAKHAVRRCAGNARTAKCMVGRRAGGAKGARMARRETCGAEMRVG